MWDSNPGPILWVLYNALPLDKKELGDCDVFLGCLDDFERHIGAFSEDLVRPRRGHTVKEQ
jgi:hypothetical protein